MRRPVCNPDRRAPLPTPRRTNGQLAVINGTLRDDVCNFCRAKGHKQFECPERDRSHNKFANVRNHTHEQSAATRGYSRLRQLFTVLTRHTHATPPPPLSLRT